MAGRMGPRVGRPLSSSLLVAVERSHLGRVTHLPTPPVPSPLPAGFAPRPFRPAPWLPSPHLQTVAGKFLRPTPDPGLERLRLSTPDGDFLDLDIAPEPTPGAPVVLILHGLEGSTARGYVRVAMNRLLREGIRPVGMNFRSCSGELNRTPRFYHSGETGDLAFALAALRSRFPDRPFGALGFSLGGNVLLKYLGEVGSAGEPEVQGAVTISVPFDLRAGAAAIELGLMGKVYSGYFIRSLRRKTTGKAELLGNHLELEPILRARTLREFDEAATAPLHGFTDADHYYRESSSKRFLPAIRVPTLLLQATDDPFLPPPALPLREVEGHPWITPVFLPRGGHVGFIEGAGPWAPRFWAEEEGARFLGALLRR